MSARKSERQPAGQKQMHTDGQTVPEAGTDMAAHADRRGRGGGGSDRPALSSSPSIARNNIVMPAHPQSEATR